jgi:hypothetical protein
MFSLLALLFSIPFSSTVPGGPIGPWYFSYWPGFTMPVCRQSCVVGFLIIGSLMLWGIVGLYTATDYNAGKLALWALVILLWHGSASLLAIRLKEKTVIPTRPPILAHWTSMLMSFYF